MKRMIFALVLSAAAPLTVLHADGDSDGRQGAPVQSEPTPNQASDASFDKRLPPVLPGEQVNDSGRKMRVWSTAGPVPVASPPEPWDCSGDTCGVDEEQERDVDIVIDERRGPRRRNIEPSPRR